LGLRLENLLLLIKIFPNLIFWACSSLRSGRCATG